MRGPGEVTCRSDPGSLLAHSWQQLRGSFQKQAKRSNTKHARFGTGKAEHGPADDEKQRHFSGGQGGQKVPGAAAPADTVSNHRRWRAKIGCYSVCARDEREVKRWVLNVTGLAQPVAAQVLSETEART